MLPNYDQVLADLCGLIIQRQKEDPLLFGMVGAAVVDKNGNIVLNTSHKKDNKWLHAERCAVTSYKLRHGNIGKDAVIVTTLSPCSDAMADRAGNSCTDFISDLGIETVYYGYDDPSQSKRFVTFDLIETKNAQIKELCKLFADIFLSN